MSRDGIRFTGVQRTYRSAAGSVEALHAVDGAFEPGGIGALVGPSGSGKSTLLRILGAVDAADAGDVDVDGVDVRHLRGAALRRFRVVTVREDRALDAPACLGVATEHRPPRRLVRGPGTRNPCD